MAVLPGARLGPYEIVALIGSGGMGEVYKAVDHRLNRTVAVKVLPAHLAADPSFQQRFEREAQVVAALNHPHICTIHDVGHHDQTHYLVMEYVDGETLADRLTKGPLPLEQALQYAIQIADALDRAHRAGIVHRDLKPGNIMLTKAGVKLLDFGLAKTGAAAGAPVAGLSMFPTTPPNLTVQGTILGTFQYMAPEQLDGQEADARTDIFAFGAVLYEMLTGRRAFEGKSQASLIAAIMHEEPALISTLQPLAPTALDRVVRKCLAKDPDARWQSTNDLHDELKWIADAAPAIQASHGSPRTRRREWMAWALAAVAVLAVAVLTLPALRYLTEAGAESPPVRFDIATPPTDDAMSFAISPDGRKLAFVANVEGGLSRLWIRSLDQTVARSLTGTENASFPFWSPDSRAVGFFADAKLKRIDVGGGTPQVLADAPSGRGGTWSADDVILFAPASNGGLLRVASTGGQTVPALQFVGAPRFPQFLPDGRHFLFYVLLGSPETQGTYLTSLDGEKPIRILPGDSAAVYAPPDYLFAVRQNTLVAFHFDPTNGTISGDPIRVADTVGSDTGLGRSGISVSSTVVLAHRGGTAAQQRQFVWVDRAGHLLSTVGARDDMTSPGQPELAPDGRRLAMVRNVQGNNDLWLMDVIRGAESRFTFNPASDNYEVWSPDGLRMAFASTRNGGSYDLFEKSTTGVDDEQSLLVTPEDKRPLSWSSDGHFLLYMNLGQNTGADLWALPMAGDRKPFPVVQTNFSESEGQFSPDGHWLAYVSNESGRFETYVRPFPGAGERVQVSTVGGSQVRWRSDGRELYYVTPDGRLMAVAINVSGDGSTLDVGAAVPLFPTVLATGAQVTGVKPQYAVGADGHFLMNNRISGATPSPITIDLNWVAGLKN